MINPGWSKLISPFHLGMQLLLAILFFFADELDRVFNLYLLLVPLIGIPAVVAVAAWVLGMIRNLVQRDWMALASVALAPVLVWSLFIALQRGGIDANWLRFQVNKSAYEATVRALPSPRRYSWDWGSTGGAGVPNIFNTLVYDETDQVAPGKTQDGKSTVVRSLGNHFYLVTEID